MNAVSQSHRPTPKSLSHANPPGSNDYPGMISCGRCTAQWTGTSACHCSGCHQTFTCLSAFDRHRLRNQCEDPPTRNLARVHKRHWSGWGRPADNNTGWWE